MLVLGFVVQGRQGSVLLGTGLALGSLAGLELSIREHFAGYRSHTLLLSAAAALVVALLAYYVADLEAPVAMVVGLAVGALAALVLVRSFQARSGRTFKLR
jgi:hypothetical protein